MYAVMAYKALTVEELLGLMKKIQGEKTNTEFAAEIGISKQYLTDIYNGRKVPSDTVSAALGYTPRVETRYFPSATAANQETPRAIPPKSKATRSRKRDSR
jgi:DNA-binding XRE family transcriptional regulator